MKNQSNFNFQTQSGNVESLELGVAVAEILTKEYLEGKTLEDIGTGDFKEEFTSYVFLYIKGFKGYNTPPKEIPEGLKLVSALYSELLATLAPMGDLL